VGQLRSNGVEFITVPPTYYDSLFADEDWWLSSYHNGFKKESLQRLGILLDIAHKRVDPNHLSVTQQQPQHQAIQNGETHQDITEANVPKLILQTFTVPLFDRPTLFFEVICRKGSTGVFIVLLWTRQ
jgi:4-hydroxyphenylpyruvate dioxygenase-like putative hemolysin